MTVSKDLFLSILAMDSYNREYGAGLVVPGSEIGLATIVGRSTLGIDDPEYDDWQAAGFYAVAYQMDGSVGEAGDQLADGQTVISYRGTDNVDPLTTGAGASDLWQVWLDCREGSGQCASRRSAAG